MSLENTGAGNEPAAGEAGADVAGFDIAAIIAKHEAGLFDGQAAADAAPPPAAPAAPPAATVASTGGTTTPPPKPADPPADPPQPSEEVPLKARQLAAYTRLEAGVRAREAKVKEDEARLTAAMAALDRGKPEEFFKAIGYDEEKQNAFVNQAWRSQLGDDAPPEVVQKAESSATNARLDRLEKMIEQALDPNRPQPQRATSGGFNAARAEALESELHAVVRSAPADLQYFALDAQEDPQGTLEALVNTTAAVMHQRGPSGQWPTALEVARMLNDEVARDVARYSKAPATPPPASNPTPPTQRVPSAPPTALSDADINRRGDRGDPQGLVTDAEYHRRAEDAANRYGGLFK